MQNNLSYILGKRLKAMFQGKGLAESDRAR